MYLFSQYVCKMNGTHAAADKVVVSGQAVGEHFLLLWMGSEYDRVANAFSY